MAEWDLRPLSLGEILDRTFSLYRRHFLLFVGIIAIPQLLILALNLARALFVATPQPPRGVGQFPGGSGGLMALGIGSFFLIIIYLVAYLFAQGATVYAVSDLYLGHQTTIGASLGRMWGHGLKLFGVTILNGLAVMAGTICLIIPGIWLACRLSTCVPAALLEDLGPGQSLSRSFGLTKDNAGRAFVIYLLYAVMLYGISILFAIPFGISAVVSAKDPAMMRTSLALLDVGGFFAGVLVGPFLLIATSVFYYDLRVRKEAYDLQMMMNAVGSVPVGDMAPRPLRM